ncbi:Crp/Fnr family transcriptional regulator [Winogradskya consettensis]|nr:Crp/Fnr family transcriptional regulator [Actinoplanes consettensis]
MSDLLPGGRVVHFPAREPLFFEGDESDHIAIILQGVVKITVSTSRGREALLALRGAGEIVGELGALYGKPRSATVRALSVVTVRVVPASTFRQRLREDPGALFAVLEAIAERLRESDRRRIEFTGFEVIDRVAFLLAELARTHGIRAGEREVEIGLKLTQAEIAGATGASLDAAAKAFRELRDQGLVRTARQKIIVLDPAKLRSAL